jgi:hypothetical protein
MKFLQTSQAVPGMPALLRIAVPDEETLIRHAMTDGTRFSAKIEAQDVV